MSYSPPLLAPECLGCALGQATKVAELTQMSRAKCMELMQNVVTYLAERGIDRSNCEQIEEVYRMATRFAGVENPYRELKALFNRGMMQLWGDVRGLIKQSADSLDTAIRAAIAGNLIDMAAQGNEVSMELALKKLREVMDEGLTIDHGNRLKCALENARTLLVLGDNCGEIAMDRLLIETIREQYPQIKVIYGVRGAETVNDVTVEDAEMVGMGEVAEVIDNGDSLLTTALYRTSEAFNRVFYAADVIIAKGMGNYEGLHNCDRENIFFLMIAKCDVLARMTRTKRGSILCLEKGYEGGEGNE